MEVTSEELNKIITGKTVASFDWGTIIFTDGTKVYISYTGTSDGWMEYEVELPKKEK